MSFYDEYNKGAFFLHRDELCFKNEMCKIVIVIMVNGYVQEIFSTSTASYCCQNTCRNFSIYRDCKE